MNKKIISPFYKMSNIIQNYAWGSTTSISSMFNTPNPDKSPQAEIWMGSHPAGCSTISIDNQQILLSDFIEENQNSAIGQNTINNFGKLPYLFKVLAAEQALSIQVHPSKPEAEIGYEKENSQGIDFKAYNRNYKDPNHKPELIYALTEYHALNGFKPYKDIINTFKRFNLNQIEEPLSKFEENQSESGLKLFFTYLLMLDGQSKEKAISELVNSAKNNKKNVPIANLILTLSNQYPGDVGLFSSLMLNYIVLQPGDAMYLEPRTPHAYLKGTGLEVMANSDNVLRAGLTPKHIDINELTKCTSFSEKQVSSLISNPEENGSALHYPIPVNDFKFSLYEKPEQENILTKSAEIIFSIDEPTILTHHSGEKIEISKGQSVFIPYSANEYFISSNGKVARVYNK